MSVEPNTSYCKQRFKAVENFLRRIAFNLGNFPSQTDVKIISCIPIDVTDLQQKIVKLQNELEDTKKNNNKNPCHVCDPPAVNPVFFERNSDDDITRCEPSNENGLSLQHSMSMSYYCDGPNNLPRSSSVMYPFNSEYHIEKNEDKRAENNQGFRNFFSKKKDKNKKKNYKRNAQVVYYAQTHERSPFNGNSEHCTSNRALNDASVNLDDLTDHLSRSFLVEMLQKQYRPEPILKVFSNSNFSAPVCRDIPTDVTTNKCHCDSNMLLCSCCQGSFHNIDRYLNKREHFAEQAFNKKSKYYDSNHYDLVPVKEKPPKIKRRTESPRGIKTKRRVAKCYPGELKPKLVLPVLEHYQHQTFPVPTYKKNYEKNVPVKVRSRRQIVLNEMASMPATTYSQPARIASPTRVCCVDYGPVYSKHVAKLPQTTQPNASILKNETPRATIISYDVPIAKPAPEQNSKAPADKTEITLNQIKVILQSVLMEVKTSGKVGNITAPPKKDAVVQNGPSQNNMRGDSHLLHSFTYSPYAMNPYSASCSRQMYSNNFMAYTSLPVAPVKCMQHYPILIQPHRPMCTSCYRNSNVVNSEHVSDPKRATSAATNTERIRTRSSETDKLIQEIYNSLALNIEIPQKDVPVSAKRDYLHRNQVIEEQKPGIFRKETSAHTVSEIYRNATNLESSETRNTDITTASKRTFNEASVGSDVVMRRLQPTRDQVSGDCETSDVNDNESLENTGAVESQSDSTITVRNRHIEQSSSEETEDDAAVVDIPLDKTKKQKKGLFNKILKIIKPRGKKIKKPSVKLEIESENDSESDSDDYQTVYSHGSPQEQAKHGLTIRSKPKLVYRKYNQRSSRSPDKGVRHNYMDQEQRRYWNDKLTLHDDEQQRYHKILKDKESLRRRAPIYNQNYEARSALVQHPMMSPNTMPQKYVDYGQHQQTMHNAIQNNLNNMTRPICYPVNYPNRQGICINYPGKGAKPMPRYITPKAYKGSNKLTSGKLSWLKKRGKNIAVPCGQQWKQFILEN